MLGLDPDSVVARVRAAGKPVLLPNLRQSFVVGTLGFAFVSVAAFSVWALGGRALSRSVGAGGFYATVALVFLVGGGRAFRSILIGENLGRFYLLFVSAFALYAGTWIAGSLMFKNTGEWLGAAIGPLPMAVLYCAAFRAWPQFGRCALLLVACHFAGYFAADRLFQLEALKNQWGMLVWGLVYGLGFGAGLSLMLHHCQSETRTRLTALVKDTPAAT